MFLPLAALLMIVSNIEAVARTTKKIAAEVIEAVDPKTEQPAPEVQDPQAAPQPEQDTKAVTYKGKVVDKDTLDNPIFEVVEHMPEFTGGGMSALMEYLSKNIKYPVAAQKAKIQGRVTIQFIVNTEGNIINPRVLRSADPLLDAEAIRLTTIMPKWKPGMQRGQAVNVKYTVPIMFRLQEPEKSPAVQNATVTPTK